MYKISAFWSIARPETFICKYAVKSRRICIFSLIVYLDNIFLTRVYHLQRLLHAHAEFSYFVLYFDFILLSQKNREIEFGEGRQRRNGIYCFSLRF